MATIDVHRHPDNSGWQWRVIDGRGQLRLAGTHPTREEALETGSFWVTQVRDADA